MKLIALTSVIYELMMNIVCERGSLNFRGNNFVRWNFWCFEHYMGPSGWGGTLGFSGWGCAAGTLEPLTYTRASSAEFCYPILE